MSQNGRFFDSGSFFRRASSNPRMMNHGSLHPVRCGLNPKCQFLNSSYFGFNPTTACFANDSQRKTPAPREVADLVSEKAHRNCRRARIHACDERAVSAAVLASCDMYCSTCFARGVDLTRACTAGPWRSSLVGLVVDCSLASHASHSSEEAMR